MYYKSENGEPGLSDFMNKKTRKPLFEMVGDEIR